MTRAVQTRPQPARPFMTVMCLIVLSACGKELRIGTRVENFEDASSGTLLGTSRPQDASAEDSQPSAPATTQVVETRDASAPLHGDASAGTGTVISPPPDAAVISASPNVNCGDTVNPSPSWPFSAGLQDWQISSEQGVSLNWVETVGASAPGAMLVVGTATEARDAFTFVPTAVQDLTGVLLTAWVSVDGTDTDVSVKLFAQSGSNYAWADGGVVLVPRGAWVCLAFSLDEPAFAVTGFDAKRVQRVGLAIRGFQYRFYVDDVSY